MHKRGTSRYLSVALGPMIIRYSSIKLYEQS